MARTKEPDYVVKGKGGGYDVQVPVLHPAYCVCTPCKNPKNRPQDSCGKEITVRTRRKSRYPKSHKQSVLFAVTLKAQIEAELRDAVAAARARQEALANAVSVGAVCAFYDSWQRAQNKDWQRDQYRVKQIREFLGEGRDATTVKYDDFTRFCAHLEKRGCRPATIRRYANTLIAVFNRAVKARVLTAHQLTNIERPTVVTTKKPVIFTNKQVATLLGSAMVRYEREQAAAHGAFEPDTNRKPPSVVPLRGFCMLAYTTLMRPETNFELRWEQLTIDQDRDRGRFRLDAHKNAGKGVNVDAPLKPELVRYLKSIMPSDEPTGLVHPNPETGLAYVNIRKQWQRLVEIANETLGPDEQLTGVRQHFYTWRHSGASHLAASSKDPVLVMRLMGDTQLATVMKHYFDSDFEHMQVEVEKWMLPVEQGVAQLPQARSESAIESDPN
ncbi:MAG: tyrosine-type recombinase/integrase [Acidobacteriota bacterium]